MKHDDEKVPTLLQELLIIASAVIIASMGGLVFGLALRWP